MKSINPKNVSTDLEEKVSKGYSFGQRFVAGVAAAAMYVALAVGGCGPNPGPNPDTVNPLPAGYSVADNMTPSNGGTYSSDDSPLEVGVELPSIPADCAADVACNDAASAGADVMITATADNGTPADSSDDSNLTVVDETGAQFGSYSSGDLNFDSFHSGAGLSDGERVTLDTTVTAYDADGVAHSTDGSVDFVYEEGVTGPRVTGCYVNLSQVGGNIDISCYCSEPAESFSLTGGPDGAMIGSSGTEASIITPRVMEASDVGLHTYSVTCTASGVTSPAYEFTVPVDEYGSRLILNCSEGGEERLLLPETSVDAVASACGSGFNPALKPDAVGDPDYILDVDHTCVQEVIDGLTSEEKEAHTHYNEGTIVDDIYSTCTVDFAQVSYTR